MASTTVRISEATRRIVQELASQTGESMRDVLEKAIEEYRRRRFFEQVNAAYEALSNDPEEWQNELQERKLLEG